MRGRLAALAAAAAAVVAIVLLTQMGPAPPRAHPLRRSGGLELALQDDAVLVQRYYGDRDRALALARRLGVSWLRVNVLWADAAGAWAGAPSVPHPVPWDWAPWDELIDAAAERGMRVEMTLTAPAPAWATGDRRIGVVSPDPRLFAQFASAAAAHFRARVSRYSIWNEPNYATWLEPQRSAAPLYRALYSAGYAAVKRADPRAQVLIGETAGPAQTGAVIPALTFLRAVTCTGADYRPVRPCARLIADGYAHHPYDFGHPPSHRYPGADEVAIGSLDRLTRALDRLAAAGALTTPAGRPLDVYLTEFGYLAGMPARLRAGYLARAFARVLADYPRVRQLLQYQLLEPPPGFPGGRFDTGVVSTTGVPEPPFSALERAAQAARSQGRLLAPPSPLTLPPP